VSKPWQTIYIVGSGDKRWSIDFLMYVLTRHDVYLDPCIFSDDISRYELWKFVRNKVWCALLEEVPRDILFDRVDIYYSELYKRAISVERRGDTYMLYYKGLKYVLPLNTYEPQVFIHEMGLRDLPRTVVKDIAGRDVIDAGAYIGDSVLVLSQYSPRRIYAIEPAQENVRYLHRTIELNDLKNIIVINKAVADRKGIARIRYAGLASVVHEVGDEVEVTTIDEIVRAERADIALIKMDIEGYELSALKGAEQTIKEFKPVLLISAYHRGRDIFEIPKFLKTIVPEYKIKFVNCNHSTATIERNLVAYID